MVRDIERAQKMVERHLQGETLSAIAQEYGISRERVRQIKDKAISKLKTNSRCKLLKGYLG